MASALSIHCRIAAEFVDIEMYIFTTFIIQASLSQHTGSPVVSSAVVCVLLCIRKLIVKSECRNLVFTEL